MGSYHPHLETFSDDLDFPHALRPGEGGFEPAQGLRLRMRAWPAILIMPPGSASRDWAICNRGLLGRNNGWGRFDLNAVQGGTGTGFDTVFTDLETGNYNLDVHYARGGRGRSLPLEK